MTTRQWRVTRSHKITGNVVVAQLTDGPSIEFAIKLTQFEDEGREFSVAAIQVWRTCFQIEHVRNLPQSEMPTLAEFAARLGASLQRLKDALGAHDEEA